MYYIVLIQTWVFQVLLPENLELILCNMDQYFGSNVLLILLLFIYNIVLEIIQYKEGLIVILGSTSSKIVYVLQNKIITFYLGLTYINTWQTKY